VKHLAFGVHAGICSSGQDDPHRASLLARGLLVAPAKKTLKASFDGILYRAPVRLCLESLKIRAVVCYNTSEAPNQDQS
jgi:hypothetical protein